LSFNYKSYWRKTGLKGKWGNIYLERISYHKPKNFLEIGVFCGVTARNTCDFLKKINGDTFNYIGIDLFGGDKNTPTDEIEPKFLLNQKFSNPLKNIYYNLLLRENLNSISSVQKLLKKYKNNTKLIAGDTNSVLSSIDLNKIDFIFLDGGHSYETVTNDLEILYKSLNGKKTVVLCDDYGDDSYIKEVRNAIDDFVKKNNLHFELIENRFAELIL
jgi:hypothetical protein